MAEASKRIEALVDKRTQEDENDQRE